MQQPVIFGKLLLFILQSIIIIIIVHECTVFGFLENSCLSGRAYSFAASRHFNFVCAKDWLVNGVAANCCTIQK